jgi:lysophospholipase L1-like esterase
MDTLRNIIFAALGDSLTLGFVPFDFLECASNYIPYTSFLDNLVVTHLSKRGINEISVTIINFGVNGDSTNGMLQRLNSHIAQNYPDYVIIWGGINDLFIGIQPEEIMENLKFLYRETMNIGAKPIACTITSVIGIDNAIPPIKKLNDMIYKHCLDESILLADLFTTTSDKKGRLLEKLSSDGIHLTQLGNERVAQTIYNDVIIDILSEMSQ